MVRLMDQDEGLGSLAHGAVGAGAETDHTDKGSGFGA